MFKRQQQYFQGAYVKGYHLCQVCPELSVITQDALLVLTRNCRVALLFQFAPLLTCKQGRKKIN
jgi:hypothetical protein